MAARTTSKTTARKTTAKKTTARTPRVKRERKPAPKLTPEIREAAAAALATLEEKLLGDGSVGVVGGSMRELKGARSGFMKAIKLDDGTKVTVSVSYSAAPVRKARVGRAKKAAAEATEES